MTKIVTNRCHGGFSISLAAARRMADLGHEAAKAEVAEYDAKIADPSLLDTIERKYGAKWYGFICRDDKERADPVLVRVVEEMGDAASGELSALEVTEIPDDVEWQIEEYDGHEWIAEAHRTW